MSDIFSEERERHFPMELPCGVIGKIEPLETYFELEDALEDEIFPPSTSVSRWFKLPPERKEAQRRLYTLQRLTHHEAVIFYDGEKPIGFSVGRMTGSSEFMMDDTGLLPEYQNKGIYSAYLKKFMPYLRDIGYERVVSYHSPTNRAVLIAKLKAGFNIVAMELREHAGAAVKMAYFLHLDRLLTFEDVHSLDPDNTRTKE